MASRLRPKSTASKTDDVLTGCGFLIGRGQWTRNYLKAVVTRGDL